MSHLPTFRGEPCPFSCIAEATSSSSAPKSMDVAAASSTSMHAPTQMETLSSLPEALASLYKVNRCRGTSLTAIFLSSMIIIRWKDTFLLPSSSATMTPAVM